MRHDFGKWVVYAIVFNTLVWGFFWTYWALTNVPAYEPPSDFVHQWGGDRHLQFWGHRLNPPNSILDSPVWIFTVIIQFPSMVAAAFAFGGLERLIGEGPLIFAGLNLTAWQFVVAVLLSYIQWYILGRFLGWGWARLRKR